MGIAARLYSFVVIRGFKVWVSYRTQVALNFISWTIPVFLYYFIGLTFGAGRMAAAIAANYSYTGLRDRGYCLPGLLLIGSGHVGR